VASELAGQGATLLLHGRSEQPGERTLAEIRARTGNKRLAYYRADYESLSEVRGLADSIQAEDQRLDVLAKQRGLRDRSRRPGQPRRVRIDLAGRLPGTVLLSYLLEPLLIAAAPGRIVNVASAGQGPDQLR
jgi:NAD(P)-dependent dehydrogenase (short-subunit alcohol dehydrogenase family)